MQNLCKMTLLLVLLTVVFLVTTNIAWANFNPIFARDHMNIFPGQSVAPGVMIDGKLDEWKAEAFVSLYPDPDLLDTFAMRIAFAYDEQGLLLAVRFTDLSPLINHNDPNCRSVPGVGWRCAAVSRHFRC